jgi:hypothetical protein
MRSILFLAIKKDLLVLDIVKASAIINNVIAGD